MSYRLKMEEEAFGDQEYQDPEDALELTDEDQEDFENSFVPDLFEVPAAEEQSYETAGMRIEDRTAVALKSNRIKKRDPGTVNALVLHQMGLSRGNRPERYYRTKAHYIILPDGKIYQLHPVSAYLYASNGFNATSVAVEFAGNFPDVKGRCWKPKVYGCNKVTPAQIAAGRFLIRHLVAELGLTRVYAHRQSVAKDNDPGPDIWYYVGQWAIDNLGLTEGGSKYKMGHGLPIPDSWRNWGRTKQSQGELPDTEAFVETDLFEDAQDNAGSEADQEETYELDALETAWRDPDREAGQEESVFEDGFRESDPEVGQSAGVSNSYFKDSARLVRAPLAPVQKVVPKRSWPSTRKSLAATYNRLGGLMRTVAQEIGVEVETALAVWQIESGGRKHQTGRAIIRFENHLLYKLWGKSNESAYDRYFRHGGRNGQPGKSWQNHQFRDEQRGAFMSFHGNQGLEYRVLSLAARLAGEDIALRCISIGGPQIVISNYRMIGYSSPRAMYEAFQADERYHVLGFFDFCRQKKGPKKGDLLKHLRQHNWPEFAKYYNGLGQYAAYGGKIGNAFQHAKAMLA